ncbi:MAG: anthranilate phosphoribosyltransferase [Myxococcota bacterium]|jgi:anthranilate phosphoribosyltransferase
MTSMLKRLLAGEDLTEAEAGALMAAMADGEVPDALAGALLVALRMKGECAAEVRGFARMMRQRAVKPDLPPTTRTMVDIVGTGGDGSGSLNLSTTAAILSAAAGLGVAKHGNRAVSSRSGSADVLEALGMPLGQDEGAIFAATGFCFLFARSHHPSMKRIAPVRAALGVRTVFNLLGPITNPVAPPYLVIGAYSASVARLLAEALMEMPIVRAFVIHGALGWDEPTPVGPFLRFDVRPGSLMEQVVDPLEVYGIARCEAADLKGGSAEDNAAAIRSICAGTPGPALDAAVLGAAQALEVTGMSAIDAVAAVRAAITDGRAQAVLDGMVR